jgi:flagellar biosynthesis protein
MDDNNKNVLKKAVALKYQMFEDNAPYIVAKGHGIIAEKIIELAKQNNIPIQEDADLITVLSKIEIMQEIPMELYKVVAEILAYVYRLNKKTINFRTI